MTDSGNRDSDGASSGAKGAQPDNLEAMLDVML